ncbi:hypothetical protein HMI56_006466 [Coelomomyces lativittatus]|nr:hypothetical protein HMI56_006466 [Coelomomyces lativittatus]
MFHHKSRIYPIDKFMALWILNNLNDHPKEFYAWNKYPLFDAEEEGFVDFHPGGLGSFQC